MVSKVLLGYEEALCTNKLEIGSLLEYVLAISGTCKHCKKYKHIVLRKELSNMSVMPTYSGKCVYSGCLHQLYPSKAISMHKQDKFD